MKVLFRAHSLGSEFLFKAVYKSTARQSSSYLAELSSSSLVTDRALGERFRLHGKARENRLVPKRKWFQTAVKL